MTQDAHIKKKKKKDQIELKICSSCLDKIPLCRDITKFFVQKKSQARKEI